MFLPSFFLWYRIRICKLRTNRDGMVYAYARGVPALYPTPQLGFGLGCQ